MMPAFNKTTQYTLLDSRDSAEIEYEKNNGGEGNIDLHPRRSKQRYLWIIHLFLAALWTPGFSVLVFHGLPHVQRLNPDRSSPLRNILTYKTTRFSTGLDGDKTKYQGAPDDTNEAVWNRRTNTGIVALTSGEQQRLHDDSALFDTSSNGETTYLGAVEVFHQFHCLDMVRREVYGTLTGWLQEHHSKKDKLEHMDHCIDYLRQSLMCRPSIEILPFGIDESTRSFKARFDGMHTCADFEAVREWAVERQAGNLTPQ